MQWTKISVKYAEHLFSDASDSVFRTYIRLLLLVTSMESTPNLVQIKAKLGSRKTQTFLDYIEEKQSEIGEDKISLNHIINKVMEDVDKVVKEREDGKYRQQKFRSNALPNAPVTPVDKIREDKIREDKKELQDSFLKRFEDIWNKYPNKDGKKNAQRSFSSSVKTDKDWEDIQTALKNYLGSERVKKGYVKNGSTWFNNWKDWVDFKEKTTEKRYRG